MQRANLAFTRIVKKLEADGIQEIAIYGAGELGIECYQLVKSCHINLVCFFDMKANSGAYKLENIPVLPVSLIAEQNFDALVICTEKYLSDIHQTLGNYTNTMEKPPLILDMQGKGLENQLDDSEDVFMYPDKVAVWKRWLEQNEGGDAPGFAACIKALERFQ